MLNRIDDLDVTRTKALSALYQAVNQLIKLYLGPAIHCQQSGIIDDQKKCDTMVLGNLLKSASRAGIYPVPPPPYQNISFSELGEMVRCLNVEGLCQESYNGYGPRTVAVKKHGLEEHIVGSVLLIAQSYLKGFHLVDYKGEERRLR